MCKQIISNLFKNEIIDKLCANKWLMLNSDLHRNTWNHLTVCKKKKKNEPRLV